MRSSKYIGIKIVPVLWVILNLLLLSCSPKKSEKQAIAIVNDRVITADEYAFFYELSPRNDTSSGKPEARMTVLNSLIDRIILAQQAEAAGLADSDSTLQNALDLYMRQAVNRELYMKHVRKRVNVHEDEEREAFNRSKKTLFVKHYHSKHENIIQDVLTGVAPFDHIPMFTGIRTVNLDGYGFTDAVSWNDVQGDLEDILFNLPLHDISEPVFDGSQFHIFKVVDFEQEVIIRDNDFQASRQSIHGILRKRKEAKTAAAFVYSVMEPQNLIIRMGVLNQLADYIHANLPSQSDPQAQYIPNEEIRFLENHEKILMQQPLALFRDGTMTVSDFLFNYKVNPQKISYDDRDLLQINLQNAIGLYVRDRVLSEKGIHENLHHLPSVYEEVQTRKEHMLAEKMIRKLYAENRSDYKADSIFPDFLKNYLTDLREEADIHVFNEKLMTVNTSDEGLSRKIDFIVVHTQ